MKLIMLGPPGSGKGTQAKKIAVEFNIPHISTGEIFRAEIKAETELGMLAKSYIDKGELVPDEVVVDIVKDRLKKDDCGNGFILDGFPRTLPQAESLEKALEEIGLEIDMVLNIEADDEEIVKRITSRLTCRSCNSIFSTILDGEMEKCSKCGGELYLRDDDREDTVRNRLTVYHKQTEPLIEFYRGKEKIKDIEQLSIEDTFNRIKDIIRRN